MASKQPSKRVVAFAAKLGKTPSQLTPEQYKAARGHGQTPEHGKLLPKQKVLITPGKRSEFTYSDRQAEKLINKAAEHENRVQLMVHTKDGGWVMVGGPRGYSGSYLAEQQAKSGGIRGATALGDIYDGSDLGVFEPDEIDAWDIIELEV